MQVNPQQPGYREYLSIVGTAMDLGTIWERLRPGLEQGWGTIHYKSTAEVLREVEAVWHACRAYSSASNPPNHEML